MSQLPPEFDEFTPRNYDPQFTADISMHMHVPEHLDVSGAGDSLLSVQLDSAAGTDHLSHMTVPDKIIVLGQDRSVGVRSDPKLHLDLMSMTAEATTSYVNLSTPPRVLTLDDRPFPHVDDGVADTPQYTATSSAAVNGITRDGTLMNSLSHGPSPDLGAVERHLVTLSEHVRQLELENTRRWKRELVLYPLLFGYVIIRLARWIAASTHH